MLAEFNVILNALHKIQSRDTERLQNIYMLILFAIVVLCGQVVVCNYLAVETIIEVLVRHSNKLYEVRPACVIQRTVGADQYDRDIDGLSVHMDLKDRGAIEETQENWWQRANPYCVKTKRECLANSLLLLRVLYNSNPKAKRNKEKRKSTLLAKSLRSTFLVSSRRDTSEPSRFVLRDGPTSRM